MKVPYFELLNPIGFMVDGIGRVHSPQLRTICERGYKNYQYALTLLLMTPHDFFAGIAAALHEEKNPYDELPQEQKDALKKFAEPLGENNYEERKKFFRKFKK